MEKNERLLNRVHTSGAVGWGRKSPEKPLEESESSRPLDKRGEVPHVTLEPVSAKRRDSALEREVPFEREAKPVPKETVTPEKGKNTDSPEISLRLEDLRLHDWVNGTGEPVDPVRKRMAGLKLNEKDMQDNG